MPATSVEPPKAFAPHRAKKQETVCLTCFRVIASTRLKRDLTRPERNHECSPYDLASQPKFGPA